MWAEAERLDVPVAIHGTSTATLNGDFTRKYLSHPAGRMVQRSVCFSVPLMTAMAGMILSGVLERYPRLRVAFLEGNCGWLPWFLYRMDEVWEMHGVETPLSKRPSDYFLKSCYISVDVNEELAEDVIRRVGDENLLLSTDYPHYDSAFPEAINRFLTLEIPIESKRKILWDNCVRFYGI